MSISSYSELKTAIATWLHRSDLTSVIPDLILAAEKRINREVRTQAMETAFNTAISSGVCAVPSDFVAWKAVYVDGSPIVALQAKPLDWIYREYPVRSSQGRPLFIARNAGNFEFGPYPDSGYTVKGTYYARLTAVESSWNALATDEADLYLFASLAEAKPFLLDDERIQIWEAKYANIRDAINLESIGGNYTGSPLTVTTA